MNRAGSPCSVAATVTADVAATSAWDVVVVGAGPAGAATAVRIAAAGRRVLLVERSTMPRKKVCGSCLSATAVRELSSLGLSIERLGGVRRTQVRLVAGRTEALLPLPGWTLSRDSLDPAIVRRAIAAGAAWLPNTRVAGIEDGPGGVRVTARATSGRPFVIRAGHAVVAAGLGNNVRLVSGGSAIGPGRRLPSSRVGLGAILPAEAAVLPSEELVMQVAREGYCGIVRLEDGRLDVAAAVDAPLLGRQASAASVVAALCGERLVRSAEPRAWAVRFTGTPPLTHGSPPVAGRWRRVLRVGDAAAYVEPFTGEGIGWALLGARAVAESLLEREASVSPSVAARMADGYERRLASHLVGPTRRCLAVSRTVRHPSIVSALLAASRAAPAAAAWALPYVVGAAGRDREGVR